jgi:hypothetical protein
VLFILKHRKAEVSVDDWGLAFTYSKKGRRKELKEIELKKDGAKTAVTDENKFEYVSLMTAAKTDIKFGSRLQAGYLLLGFHSLVPPKLLSYFTRRDLDRVSPYLLTR